MQICAELHWRIAPSAPLACGKSWEHLDIAGDSDYVLCTTQFILHSYFIQIHTDSFIWSHMFVSSYSSYGPWELYSQLLSQLVCWYPLSFLLTFPSFSASHFIDEGVNSKLSLEDRVHSLQWSQSHELHHSVRIDRRYLPEHFQRFRGTHPWAGFSRSLEWPGEFWIDKHSESEATEQERSSVQSLSCFFVFLPSVKEKCLREQSQTCHTLQLLLNARAKTTQATWPG